MNICGSDIGNEQLLMILKEGISVIPSKVRFFAIIHGSSGDMNQGGLEREVTGGQPSNFQNIKNKYIKRCTIKVCNSCS